MSSRTNDPAGPDLAGYEVLVCVCGGIAAYKVCEVVSRMAQRGAGITVAMSKAARRFVGPVTFQALSGRAVLKDLWKAPNADDVQHIWVTERADLVIVAPATANVMAKMAAGLADDLVSTLLVSADSPVMLAPAMNDRMWSNPIVQRNVRILKEHGMHIVDPVEGWLACRSVGCGRMAEPDAVIEAAVSNLRMRSPKARQRRDD